MRTCISISLILFSFAFPAYGASIEISNPMAMSQPNTDAPGAVALTIINNAGADKLVSAKTPVAKMAQIHNKKVKRGKMRMRRKTSRPNRLNARVYAVDANSYFSRPGPRLAPGVELLAHLLHPELVPRVSGSLDLS